MFGREAAPPPPVVLSVVDEINYGWTQHFTKSVAYTLPIGKKTTFEFAAKSGFSEPFDTTFFDTNTILIPSSTEISIPILILYRTNHLKILILIQYRYFMEMV